ncbi:hypothetical protein [Amedibacillus sp. YH-ame10]
MAQRHLLDEIAYRSEMSISDFRYDENIVLFRKFIQEIDPNDYSLEEWNEVIQYIYDASIKFQTMDEVLKYLRIEKR